MIYKCTIGLSQDMQTDTLPPFLRALRTTALRTTALRTGKHRNCLEDDCPENGKAPFLPLTEKGQDTHNRKSPVTSSWRLRWRVE